MVVNHLKTAAFVSTALVIHLCTAHFISYTAYVQLLINIVTLCASTRDVILKQWQYNHS